MHPSSTLCRTRSRTDNEIITISFSSPCPSVDLPQKCSQEKLQRKERGKNVEPSKSESERNKERKPTWIPLIFPQNLDDAEDKENFGPFHARSDRKEETEARKYVRAACLVLLPLCQIFFVVRSRLNEGEKGAVRLGRRREQGSPW